MNLYIETDSSGNPINHPAFEDNLIQAFGGIPAHWEAFVRIERPIPGLYQVVNDETYQKINGVWTDVWTIREMTDEEKAVVQQEAKDLFNNRPQASNWSSWTLDPITCKMQPPIPRPAPDQTKLDQGIMTVWCGADNNWKDTPPKPTDDKNYIFDFFAWEWTEYV